MIKSNYKSSILLILFYFLLNIVNSQTNRNLNTTTNNAVHGILVSAKATTSESNNLAIIVNIRNLKNIGFTELKYKIEVFGSNAELLKDTIIKLYKPELKNSDYSEFIFTESLVDGKIVRDTMLNIQYLEYIKSPEYINSKYLILPKASYNSEVFLNVKGIVRVRVKPLSASFGDVTYLAPGAV